MTPPLTLALVVLVVTACSETGAPADTTLPPALSTFPRLSPEGSQAPSSTAPSRPLAGVQNVTRIRNGLSDLAHDWGLIDPEGSYSTSGRSGGIRLVEPVEGYGDFSGLTIQQRFDLDATTVQELTYERVSDTDSDSLR